MSTQPCSRASRLVGTRCLVMSLHPGSQHAPRLVLLRLQTRRCLDHSHFTIRVLVVVTGETLDVRLKPWQVRDRAIEHAHHAKLLTAAMIAMRAHRTVTDCVSSTGAEAPARDLAEVGVRLSSVAGVCVMRERVADGCSGAGDAAAL